LDLIRPQHTVECNVCGWRGRKFGYTAAISIDYFAANNLCLNCGSNKKTRVTLQVLADNIGMDEENLIVVDIGPASSTRRYFRRYPSLQYRTLDKFKNADINSDVAHIALADDSVDVIICCHILEHVEDYDKAIRELFRVLKPGRRGIILVPQVTGLEMSRRALDTTFQGYGHIWEFGDDFSDKLSQAGFQVSTVYRSIQAPTKKPLHVVSKPFN
jgi:SAM-dependent methyltransferase